MDATRRRWVAGTAGLLTLAGTQSPAGAQGPALVQPAVPGRDAFLDRAHALRDAAVQAGDQPYGALVVSDGRIVGEARSRVVTVGDPTAHAELEAVRDACRRLGTRNLAGCELYSSARPCPMCEAAAYWAGIGRMIHGRPGVDAGAPRLARC